MSLNRLTLPEALDLAAATDPSGETFAAVLLAAAEPRWDDDEDNRDE